MAGRIRSIKPELLDDEKTAGLSHFEFRLFIALLLVADDYGNLRAQTSLLAAQVFWGCPASEPETRVALDTLAEVGLVQLYDVRGQTYAHICGWSKHQKVDKPGKPRVPGPDEPETREARRWRTYFLRLGEDGPIKIGKTIDLDKRVAKLQTAAPAPLHVLRVIEGDQERGLHHRFASLRTHGEWFDAAPELLKFIDEEPFANSSRMVPERLAPDPDLRPPIPTTDPKEKESTRAHTPPEGLTPKQRFAKAWGGETAEYVPDGYEIGGVFDKLTAYAEATSTTAEEALPKAVKALREEIASWSSDDRPATAKLFNAKWAEVQARMAGKVPSSTSKTRAGPSRNGPLPPMAPVTESKTETL